MADKLKVKEPATSKRRGKRNAAYKESWEQHKQEQSPKICINILIIVNIVSKTIIDNKIFNSIKRHPIITIITLLFTVTSVFGSVYSEEIKNFIRDIRGWFEEEESDEPTTTRELISLGKNPDDTMIKDENEVSPHKLISHDSAGNHSPSEFPQKDSEPQFQSPQLTDETTGPEGKEGKQPAATPPVIGGSKSPTVPRRSEREYRTLRDFYTEINSNPIDLSSFKPNWDGGRLKVLVENEPIDGESTRVGDGLFDYKIDEAAAWDLCLTISKRVEKGDLLKSQLEKRAILNTCIEVANAKGREDMVPIFRKSVLVRDMLQFSHETEHIFIR